jgi:hypothetical protein
MKGLVEEGRWQFQDEPASVEEIVTTLDESMSEAQEYWYGYLANEAEAERLEKGGEIRKIKGRTPKGPKEGFIKTARKAAAYHKTHFEDGIGEIASLFGQKAGEAFEAEAKSRARADIDMVLSTAPAYIRDGDRRWTPRSTRPGTRNTCGSTCRRCSRSWRRRGSSTTT